MPETCEVKGCTKKVHAAGRCRTHYARRNAPDADAPIRPRAKPGEAKSERFMGLMLKKSTIATVRREAKQQRSSEHAVIVGAVERWAAKQ